MKKFTAGRSIRMRRFSRELVSFVKFSKSTSSGKITAVADNTDRRMISGGENKNTRLTVTQEITLIYLCFHSGRKRDAGCR